MERWCEKRRSRILASDSEGGETLVKLQSIAQLSLVSLNGLNVKIAVISSQETELMSILTAETAANCS